MVSGDHVNTARAVAVKCGIIKPQEENLIYDGKEFNDYIRDPDGQVSILFYTTYIYGASCGEF